MATLIEYRHNSENRRKVLHRAIDCLEKYNSMHYLAKVKDSRLDTAY